MLQNKLFRHFLLALGLMWLGADVKGEDAVAPTTFKPRTFETSIRPAEVPGWEQVRWMLVSAETNEFGLMAPHGFRIDNTVEKITMISSDASYFLTVRLLVPVAADA